MKAIILLTAIVISFCLTNVSHASMAESPKSDENLMMEDQFLKICEKVIVFLKNNPDKNNLPLEGLVKEGVISKVDYDFIVKNKIKYNPPSSAGENDNFLSIFDRENEDRTSTHILYNLVDKSDPSITKTGNISLLNRCLTEWYEYKSDKKSLSIFNNKDFYYFDVWYNNNEHWDKQHGILIDFPESNREDIQRFKNLLQAEQIKYREYVAQSDLHLDVMLPSDFTVIKNLCTKILEKVFFVKPDDVINYTPDGFRFKKDKE